MKINSSFSIVTIFIICSFVLWALLIGICWSIYSLEGPYNEFNEQLKIFKWIYRATDIYLPLITIASIFLSIVAYKNKKKVLFKGFLFSSIYSALICMLYFIIIHV
jgi:hypothetical protein